MSQQWHVNMQNLQTKGKNPSASHGIWGKPEIDPFKNPWKILQDRKAFFNICKSNANNFIAVRGRPDSLLSPPSIPNGSWESCRIRKNPLEEPDDC